MTLILNPIRANYCGQTLISYVSQSNLTKKMDASKSIYGDLGLPASNIYNKASKREQTRP